MSSPLGTTDFFALEAGECVARLETLLGQEVTAGDEVTRAARALRGAALMVGQRGIARAAGGLEALGRALRDGRVRWEPAVREEARQSLEEFRHLIRRVSDWGDADVARATRLGESLESLAGGTPPGRRTPVPPDANTGVRAFIAREAELIAHALDRSAAAIRTAPNDRESLYKVIRRMQPLRGLAEVSELPPLPDILDGVELAVGDLTRLFAPPAGVDAVLEAAARALARASSEVMEQGRPAPDSPEARRFTELLLRTFAAEPDVVPIESLLANGAVPVRQGGRPPELPPPHPLGPLELVSLGEHLCQSADAVERAGSGPERDLRLYALVSAFRTLGAPGPGPVASSLAALTAATRERIAAGDVTRAPAAFAARLREVGALLRKLADGADPTATAQRLAEIAAQTSLTGASEADVISIEALWYDGEDFAAAAIVPIDALAPNDAAPADEGGLEGSFVTYARLVREDGSVASSLAEFLGQASEADEAVVDVADLCYRGLMALERAAIVRDELKARLSRHPDLEDIQPLLEELLDLVPLALDRAG